jgi:hypothetical protein
MLEFLFIHWKMRIAKIVRIVVCLNLPTISNKGQVILKVLVESKKNQ